MERIYYEFLIQLQYGQLAHCCKAASAEANVVVVSPCIIKSRFKCLIISETDLSILEVIFSEFDFCHQIGSNQELCRNNY